MTTEPTRIASTAASADLLELLAGLGGYPDRRVYYRVEQVGSSS